ncbi:MAG: hypothetical protein AAFW84_28260 [Cyanobacteria bacterium J06635_15]
MAQRINNTRARLIEPTRVAEGFLIVDPGDAWSWGTFLGGGVFVLILCGVSLPIGVGLWVNVLTGAGSGVVQWVPLLVTTIFAVVGIAGLVWGIRWLLLIARLKPGELILPQYPLRLGESCRIRYRRQLRSGSTRRRGKVTAQLICYEWVQYRQGTDTKTATHTLWEETFSTWEVDTGIRQVDYETQIQVAAEMPPSFEARSNQIRWEVRVKLDLPGIAKDASHFRFKVIPEEVA